MSPVDDLSWLVQCFNALIWFGNRWGLHPVKNLLLPSPKVLFWASGTWPSLEKKPSSLTTEDVCLCVVRAMCVCMHVNLSMDDTDSA